MYSLYHIARANQISKTRPTTLKIKSNPPSNLTLEMNASVVDVDSNNRQDNLKSNENNNHQAPNCKTQQDMEYLAEEVLLRVGYTWLVLRRTPAITISKIAVRNLKGTSLFTSIYIISNIQFNSMSKSCLPAKQTPSGIDTDDSSQELDIRLKRQVFLCSQAQQQLILAKNQLQYCSSFLMTLKEQHQSIKKHDLRSRTSPFGGWQNKIKQLSVSALTIQSQDFSQKLQQIKTTQHHSAQCNQKMHLKQIFQKDGVDPSTQDISLLEQKLQNLYGQISSLVMQEYLNDKIFLKIKRQAHRASKEKTLQYLGQEIGRHKDWMKQSQLKVENEIAGKEVKDKIIHNLQMMKLIMNKKVINNDYIYEEFEEKREKTQHEVDKILSLPGDIQTQYNAAIKQFKERFIQDTANRQAVTSQPIKSKTIPKLDLQLVQNYLNQASQTLQQLDNYHHQGKIRDQCDILSSRLDALWSSLKR